MKRLGPDHVLTRLVAASQRRLDDTRHRVPDAIVRKMAEVAPAVPSFHDALVRPGTTRVIAEIKKASPSAGVLAADLDVDALARSYRNSGAAAISVVTEPEFFQGSLAWIRTASTASGLPVLRKDFLYDRYQVAETRAAGASAVLLIVAMLLEKELSVLLEAAADFGLDALVEVHDESELDEAIGAGARIVGVNNRDLKTFEVDLETSTRLGKLIPEGIVFVAESGIRGKSDLERLRAAGANAFLIGESLVRSPDPAAALEAFL